MDSAVKVVLLPEPLSIALEFAGGSLHEGLEKLRHNDRRRLIHQQVDMLGHQDVGVDSSPMTCPNLLRNSFDRILGFRRFKERETVTATEGDEVKGLGFLEPFQTVGHGPILIAW